MLTIQKILFPIDFSDRNLAAAPYVAEMARRFRAAVTLLTVVGRRDQVFFAPEFGATSLMEQFELRLRHAKELMSSYLADQFTGISLVRQVLEGDPATEIVSHAHRHQVDLIMMPSHGFGVFRRYVLGSVTAKVLHDAACPVWTGVHLEGVASPAAIRYSRVVCAVDFGEQSQRTLSWASGFCAVHDAELLALHAVAWEPLRGQAEHVLAQSLRDKSLETRLVVEEGEPAKVVHDCAVREHADLLIIGRGSAASGDGRLRTHAYALIRSSPCPVVSV